jgi:DNA-binding CsgD family transcriptional regulator
MEDRIRTRSLSPREIECLAWAAQGKTYKEIGMLTGLAYGTVKSYLDTARAKLNAVNLPHAVALAIIYGHLFMPEENIISRQKNADRYYGEMWGVFNRPESAPYNIHK